MIDNFVNFDYVLYHAGCDDGFGAAWAIHKVIPDAKYIPVQHGQSPPELPLDASVVMVDFSYDRDTIKQIWIKTKNFLILDHHKSAEEELKNLPYARFDMKRSGAMMTWEYFHPDVRAPALINYIQDRDLWHKELTGSENYTAALRSYAQDFNIWDNIAGRSMYDLIDEGGAILRAIKIQVQRQCENIRLEQIGPHKVPVVNATCYISEVCEEIINQNPEAEFAASYFIRADNKRVYSLRSRGDFDVSKIATILGGGGHKNAAGFVR